MSSHARANAMLFFGSLLACTVAYPAVLLAVGQGLFPTAANGSLVTAADGKPVGSTLIAQAFTRDEYFWPRPSAAGYNAAATGGSNWGANNPKLRDRVAQQLGPLVRYKKDGPRKGEAVGPDIETWFAAEPDRAAKWAAAYPTSATNWAKADLTGDKYGPNGEFITAWAKDHPEAIAEWKTANPTKADDPKPEDLVGPFFDRFAKSHAGTFPGVVEVKAADGTMVKTVQPVRYGATIQAVFFESWLQDPANADRVADIEPVPADFVTASGAGVDPHITLRNARWQLDRVATARAAQASNDAVAARRTIVTLLAEKTAAPFGGLAGEPLVNVLEINLALDATFAGQPR